jgi:hypothetical protein
MAMLQKFGIDNNNNFYADYVAGKYELWLWGRRLSTIYE